MRYKDCIEKYFLIDEPKSGQLVPFKFRDVQNRFYDQLIKDYDIESNGLSIPVREVILKARREGFTSMILALFAVDDFMSENPTESLVISYKDDGTQTFRKRYRTFLTSYAARKQGCTVEQIQKNPNILDQMAKQIFLVDSIEIELKHNKAHFYCGTASARVGGRGATVQKLLFSEAAFYPDKKELRAKEIIEGTMRQVDIDSGWVFVESTANGDINHYAKMWNEAQGGGSRFKPRFFSWREFYTEEQFEIIKSEFTDKRMIPQEYPSTPEESFLSSGDRHFDPTITTNLKTETPIQQLGSWNYYREYEPGHRYAIGCDVSEGVGRHNSTIVILDFDTLVDIGGRKVQKPKVVALYANNKIAPDLFAYEIKSGGNRYGNCIAAPERNNHGFATLATLKGIYFNIYKDEKDKLGFHTNLSSKPRMLHELRTAMHEDLIDISDPALKQEIISYPSIDLNVANVDEEDETTGHYDRVIACFVHGTMVFTDKGYRPIETIQVNDKVMTRKGYRRVLKTSAKIDKVIHNIGLTGTSNHPVICADGIKNLSDVRNGDMLYVWDSKKQTIEKLSYTGAQHIIGIQKQNKRTIKDTLWEGQNGRSQEYTSIGRFGWIILGRYQKVIWSIMKTIIQIITPLKTFVYYLQENIQKYTWQNLAEGKKLGGFLILKKIEENKQLIYEERLRQKKRINWSVLSVARSFIQLPITPSFARANAYKHTLAQKGETQKWIESVSFADEYFKQVFRIKRDVPKNAIHCAEENTYQQVFNLEVEDAQEYFANGILVHNCAIAWQMRSLAMPTMIQEMKDEDVKQFDRYAMFGEF